LRRSILRTLAYFDIFSYPLTADEIYHNLGDNHTNLEEVKGVLKNLSEIKFIYQKDKFFLLRDNDSYIYRRKLGNNLAENSLKTAKRVSCLISRFPFIRGILLSGSISKGFMEKDSDIDYFIITHPNRVWFSKLMLMLFKKIFLFNSKKIFCVNYFVDSENLEIHEKNLFTATETVTLLPTFGKEFYEQFYEKNTWTKDYYPNFPKRTTEDIIEGRNGWFKSTIEKILSNNLGDKIDDFAMRLFEKFNKRKYKYYNPEEFKLAFKSSKKESKHHPKFFQKRVLEEYNKRIKLLEKQLNISL
jgi:hypothetical protein